MITLAELFTPVTREEAEDSILQICADVGLSVTSWQPLGVARTIVASVAQKVADASSIMAGIAAGGLLDYAATVTPEGGPGWLDLLSKSGYNVERIAAVYATGSYTLTNTSVTSYPFNIGDLHVAIDGTDKTFTNTTEGTLAGNSTLTLTIAADEAGAASSAAPNTITTFVTPLIGVTGTNAASIVGQDAETNAALVQRCRDKLGSLSPDGPKEAYAFFAKTQADGKTPIATSVPITRAYVVTDPTTGYVYVYVANADGAVSGGDVALVDDNLQALATPLCVTCITASAVDYIVDVTADVWIGTTGLTDDQIKDAISTKLAVYFSAIPIGGFTGALPHQVFVDAIIGQIFIALPTIQEVTLAAPAANITLLENFVAVLGDVVITVHRV